MNRHGGTDGLGDVIDFVLDRNDGLTLHPGAKRSADVLGRLFAARTFDRPFEPADLVTRALKSEVRDEHGRLGQDLERAERDADYPAVACKGRLIDGDTRLVVVKPELRDRLQRRERVASLELLGGSVPIWSKKLEWLGLEPIGNRPDVFWWPHAYEADFLGYMKGALPLVTGSALVF